MNTTAFVELTTTTSVILFLVGFIGGMVSGFIGSGGAFVLTPAMMSLGVPSVVAVASNMAHKFPKALVGAYKRNKYGQVDVKLGVVMGVFAEAGVLFGKHVMVDIREVFGPAGTNLYVSFVFVVVLGIVGVYVLRDGLRDKRGETSRGGQLSPLVRWVRKLRIPGTMLHFKSIDGQVSFLVLAPLGFATGLLAATIAVGGFIGVPAMMYVLGVSAMTASATELVIAFVMGLGGSYFYALDGFVDIRLSMIILAGSLFGIQIGAIGTTYVKEHLVKFVMATIMLLVLVSRFFYIPGYLADLQAISLSERVRLLLDSIGEATLAFALVFGAGMILHAIVKGMRAPAEVPDARERVVSGSFQLSPLGRFERFLVACDGTEFSAAAVRETIGMASRCGAKVHVMTLVPTMEHAGLGNAMLKQEMQSTRERLARVKARCDEQGVRCQVHVLHGHSVDREIVELADKVNADVIVMGRRGKGLASMILSRATVQVIGRAHCNVLVVPREAKVEGRHIVLATDGSRYAEAAAVTAASLGHFCQTKVTVVSATDKPEQLPDAEQAVQRVVQHMESVGTEAEGIVRQGYPPNVIAAVGREKEADLIITGSHGRTGLDRVLMGSTSVRVLNDTPCAVLVVKAA